MKKLHLMALLLAAAGLAFLLAAFWIPAKAWLAYRLLDQASRQVAELGTPQKPWQWADFGVQGTLDISGKRIHVLDRATGQALAFGAGLHEEANGFGPHILSGHRDTHFSILEQVREGDQIDFSNLGTNRTYRIAETRIFDIREGTLQTPANDALLLMTCWPFDGINPDTPKRFLVLAVPDRP